MSENSSPEIVVENTRPCRKQRLTCYVTWSASFISLAGFWAYGYSLGTINSGYREITKAIESHYKDRWQENVSSSSGFVETIYVTSSGMYPLGGLFGSLVVREIVCRIGRLRGMLFGHFLTILFSIVLGISDVSRSPELLIIARFGIGVTTGFVGTGISVMYIAEISCKNYRGALGTLESLSIAISLVAGDVLGLPQILGSSSLWPILLAFTGLPSVAFVALYWAIPDSPRELYIDEGKDEDAEKLLKKLYDADDVTEIMVELEEERNFRSIMKLSIKQLLTSKRLRPCLVAGIVIAAGSQITGANGVTTNLANIFIRAGLDEETTRYASIGVFSSLIFVRILDAYLVEKFGRKILLIICYATQGFFLVVMTITIEVQDEGNVTAYISIAASMGYLVAFSIGAAPVTLLLIAELFDQASRPAAVSISSAIYWLGFLIVTVITPYMLSALGGYTFVPFAIVSFFVMIFIVYELPETKNKTFKEIQLSFHRRVGNSNETALK